MKKNMYPALEGMEVLSAQAIAAIEAAEEAGKPNPNCTQCIKSRQRYNGGDIPVDDVPIEIELPR